MWFAIWPHIPNHNPLLVPNKHILLEKYLAVFVSDKYSIDLLLIFFKVLREVLTLSRRDGEWVKGWEISTGAWSITATRWLTMDSQWVWGNWNEKLPINLWIAQYSLKSHQILETTDVCPSAASLFKVLLCQSAAMIFVLFPLLVIWLQVHEWGSYLEQHRNLPSELIISMASLSNADQCRQSCQDQLQWLVLLSPDLFTHSI